MDRKARLPRIDKRPLVSRSGLVIGRVSHCWPSLIDDEVPFDGTKGGNRGREFGGREESFIASAHSGCRKITRHPCSFVMRELMRLVSTRVKHVYSKNYPSRTWPSILLENEFSTDLSSILQTVRIFVNHLLIVLNKFWKAWLI